MPTKNVSAATGGTDFATVPLHKKLKLTALNIDNQYTAEITLELIDTFTPDVSNGVASPSEQTPVRLQVTIPAGVSLSYQEDALKDIEFLGVGSVKASVTSASCEIFANFHFV